MGLLRIIRNDIQWLNSRPPAAKIVALIVGIVLIVGAWYMGAEWWTTPVLFKIKELRYRPPTPRLELTAVVLGIILICYLFSVIDRYRRTC